MKAAVAVLSVLLSSAVHAAPAAEAGFGAAVCTVNGTVSFSAPAGAAEEGTWRIGPATIACQGVIYGRERILGRGPLEGSGTFGLSPAGAVPCTRDLGPGIIDYTIPTTAGNLRITEPITAGAGIFTTPTMSGSFQFVPPYEGDCAPNATSSTALTAEGVLTRRDANPG